MQETRRDFMKLVAGAVAGAGVLMTETQDAQAEAKSPTETQSREFRAGEKIPGSGVYDVVHDRIDGQVHAADHQLTLVAGACFPNCKVCRGWVKFRLHQAGNVSMHPDFA